MMRPGKDCLDRAGVFGHDADRGYIRELAHDLRCSVKPGKGFCARSRSLISDHDGAWRLEKMKHPVERIRSANINLLRFRIETLEAGFVAVLIVKVEQYRIEFLCSDPCGESGNNGRFSDPSLTALIE